VDYWCSSNAKSEENWLGSRERRQALIAVIQLSDGDREAAELLVRWSERRAKAIIEKHWPQV